MLTRREIKKVYRMHEALGRSPSSPLCDRSNWTAMPMSGRDAKVKQAPAKKKGKKKASMKRRKSNRKVKKAK